MVRRSRTERVSLAVFGLVALGFTLLLALRPAVDQVDPREAGQEVSEGIVQEMIAAVQQMDDGEMDEAAKAVASETGLFAAAATCGMRRSRLLPTAPRDLRTRFVLASLRTDASRKAEMLSELAAHSEPHVRFQAFYRLASVAARAGDADAARQNARAALEIQGIDDTCRADAHYLMGRLASKPAASERDLRIASDLDPGAWQVHADLLPVLTAQLERVADASACVDRTRAMIRSVILMDNLAPSDEHLAALEVELTPAGSRMAALHPARAFAIGVLRERTNRPDLARETYQIARRVSADGACGQLLRVALDKRLERLDRNGGDADG